MVKITSDMICRGQYFHNGKRCAIGWLNRLYSPHENFIKAVSIMKNVVGATHQVDIPGWNDDKRTTEEEIAEALNETQRRFDQMTKSPQI